MKNKTKILLAVLVMAGGTVKAQPYWNSSSISTATTGDCSIGNNLAVQGGLIDMTIPGLDNFRSINCGSSAAGLYLCTGTSTMNGTYIQMHAPNETTNPGGVDLVSNSPAAMGFGFSFTHHDFSAGTDNSLMQLDTWGRLAIKGGTIDLLNSALGVGVDNFRSINCGSSAGGLYLCTGTSTMNGTYIQMHAPGEISDPGAVSLVSNSPGGTGSGFSFTHHDISLGSDNSLMHLDNFGNMELKGGTLNLWNTALGVGVDNFRSINCASSTGGLYLCTGTSTTNGTYIQMHAPGEVSNPGAIDIVSNSSGVSGLGVSFTHHDIVAGTDNTAMRIYNDGKVAIGSDIINTGNVATTTWYNLYVSKGILTEKLKVALSGDVTNWSDYVFNKEYSLMPLNKVESFVKENKHLPDVPSAAEVAKDGIDVARMDAKLLQKIEELTLYVIQQQKEIDELKKRN